MECKHVTGPGSVSSEADVAYGQLTNGDIRIIAMDVSGAIHREEFWTRDWGDLEIQGAVHAKIWDICEEQENEQQQGEFYGPNGFLVEATIPYANSQFGPSTCFGAIGNRNHNSWELMDALEYLANHKPKLLFS